MTLRNDPHGPMGTYDESPLRRRQKPAPFLPGDLVAAPDRFGIMRTGLYSGNVITYTTKFTATGKEVPRRVPLVTVTVIDRPSIIDGKGSSGFAVDVRKLRAATAEEERSDIRPLLDSPSPGNWADWTREMREAECERWCSSWK